MGVTLLLALASCPSRLLTPADGESRVRAQLQATTQLHEQLAGGDALELRQLRFSEVVVALQGDDAEVLAHAEASGTFRGAELNYVGSERFVLRHGANGYTGTLLPALLGVLTAVAQRQDAIARQDSAALLALAASDYREGSVDRSRLAPLFTTLWPTVERAPPSAMAVRVDHDRAVVSLHFEGDGGTRTHTLALENETKSWRYSAGLL
jgi:hypothetical protein